jgi:L-amino acid N-acyltransferase YncA
MAAGGDGRVSYVFGVEKWAEAWPVFEPLMRRHYGEMADRLAAEGHDVSPFAPRVDAYQSANERGEMVMFTIRKDGEPVGYSMIYVTRSMHNGDLVANEDTIYVHPDHRNGIGRKLTKLILGALRQAGVKRAYVSAATDPRATKLWQRMGFKPTAQQMTYYF